MNRNERKNTEQIKAIKLWIAAGCRGLAECCTGFGKTRLGVLAAKGFHAKYGKDFKVLIITPTETIRDNAWKAEFKKWGASKAFKECVDTVCIQTAHKWTGGSYDLVVLDECHNFSSQEYSKFFDNNYIKYIMGLSATLDKEHVDFYKSLDCPVVYKIGLTEAKRLKLVSDYNIYNIGVNLSPSEKYDYDIANSIFNRTFPIFQRDLKLMFKCMDSDFFERYCAQHGYDYDEVKGFPFQCNGAIASRKNIIYDCQAKIDLVKQISNLMPDKLGIVFSERTSFADKVTKALGNKCVSFHSKISKKQRAINLKKLTDGRTKVNMISTGKALNEGANIPRCSLGIIASGTGKARSTIQRVGRQIRFEENKVATIVRIYVKDSQEEKWVESAQKEMDAISINNIDEIRL